MPSIFVTFLLCVWQYDFGVEKWVLGGQQRSYPSAPQIQLPRSPSEAVASCPPFWLMFSSPQEGRLARHRSSELWEPSLRQRSRSLNGAELRYLHPKVKFLISDSEGDEGYSEDDEGSSTAEDRSTVRQDTDRPPSSTLRRQCHSLKAPGPSSRKRNPTPLRNGRKASSSSLQEYRQGSLDRPRTSSPQRQGQRRPKRRMPVASRSSRQQSLSPQPPSSSPPCHLQLRPATAGHVSSIRNHKPTTPVRYHYCSTPTVDRLSCSVLPKMRIYATQS